MGVGGPVRRPKVVAYVVDRGRLAHAHSVAAGQAALVGRMYDRPTPHLTG